MYAPTDPEFKEGGATLNMVQNGIMDNKINKSVDREEILEENLKRAFTILHGQCTESLLAKMGGDSKYEAIYHDQNIIEMLNLVKGGMFEFDGNK